MESDRELTMPRLNLPEIPDWQGTTPRFARRSTLSAHTTLPQIPTLSTRPAPLPGPAAAPAHAPEPAPAPRAEAVALSVAAPGIPRPSATAQTEPRAQVEPVAATVRVSRPISVASQRPLLPALPEPGVRTSAFALLAICVGALLYASHVSMSAALVACAALILSDLALGAASKLRIPLVAATALTTVMAIKSALHNFGEMAFVAGLFVIVAIIPVLILHTVAGKLLTRGEPSIADLTVATAGVARVAAFVVTLVAGYLAFHSYIAAPDALVTFPILALVALNIRHALANN